MSLRNEFGYDENSRRTPFDSANSCKTMRAENYFRILNVEEYPCVDSPNYVLHFKSVPVTPMLAQKHEVKIEIDRTMTSLYLSNSGLHFTKSVRLK